MHRDVDDCASMPRQNISIHVFCTFLCCLVNEEATPFTQEHEYEFSRYIWRSAKWEWLEKSRGAEWPAMLWRGARLDTVKVKDDTNEPELLATLHPNTHTHTRQYCAAPSGSFISVSFQKMYTNRRKLNAEYWQNALFVFVYVSNVEHEWDMVCSPPHTWGSSSKGGNGSGCFPFLVVPSVSEESASWLEVLTKGLGTGLFRVNFSTRASRPRETQVHA